MSILDQDYDAYHFRDMDHEQPPTCDRCRIAWCVGEGNYCGRCQVIVDREEQLEATFVQEYGDETY
jgi:hypothetical protein